MPFVNSYLTSVKKQFAYYKYLGEQAIAQIDEEAIHRTFGTSDNSIATIVKHLHGNMKSRWTDFLTTDGEKSWRNRDEEFKSTHWSKKELLQKWSEGWDIVFNALSLVNEKNFDTIVYIRNEGHSLIDVFNRQMSHYSYHIGQIVYLAKSIQSNAWKSLSIPIGQSDDFNKKKFRQEKSMRHFTQDHLDK